MAQFSLASGNTPNLSLNPDAPSAGARNILARSPFRRAG